MYTNRALILPSYFSLLDQKQRREPPAPLTATSSYPLMHQKEQHNRGVGNGEGLYLGGLLAKMGELSNILIPAIISAQRASI